MGVAAIRILGARSAGQFCEDHEGNLSTSTLCRAKFNGGEGFCYGKHAVPLCAVLYIGSMYGEHAVPQLL